MNKWDIKVFAVFLALSATGYSTTSFALDDNIVAVPTGDKQMVKAMNRARETLDIYWAAVDKPNGRKGFAVKVKITDKYGSEHFWLNRVKRKASGFSGYIANTPALVKKVKEGELYKFKAAEISDWMFFEKSKIVGGFTIRVLADRMPKTQADKFKAMLAYEPK